MMITLYGVYPKPVHKETISIAHLVVLLPMLRNTGIVCFDLLKLQKLQHYLY